MLFSDQIDTVSDRFSFDSSSSSTPPSPSKPRNRPAPRRLHEIGIDPSDLVGKVLTRVRRSPHHPTVTLDFADNTTFQLLIDGYDPVHRGVPKFLEMDSDLMTIFNPPSGQSFVHLTVVGCASITMTDRAFEMKEKHEEWDQNHLGIAFKFGGDGSWHCVWATLAECDEERGTSVFRSYDDVYLNQLQRSPRKHKPHSRTPKRAAWK